MLSGSSLFINYFYDLFLKGRVCMGMNIVRWLAMEQKEPAKKIAVKEKGGGVSKVKLWISNVHWGLRGLA